MNGIDVFAAAERWPNHVALETECDAISYSELAERAHVAYRAAVAALGPLDPTRPIGWIARPSIDALALFLGIVSRGIPVCTLHPTLTAEERSAQVECIAPQGVFDGAELTPVQNPDSTDRTRLERDRGLGRGGLSGPIAPESPLAVLFTSGTTAGARPVVLSHRAFVESARASASRLGWSDDDKWLLTLPLAHVGGLSVVTRCLLAGRTILMPQAALDTAAVLSFAQSRAATLASLVPTQLARWLSDPCFETWRSLRAVLVGGAAASPSLFDAGRSRGLPLLRTYGMTEACSQVATELPGAAGAAPTDCGPPLPGYEVRAVAGVLEIRSPSLMSGIWPSTLPQLEPGGWLRTNDKGWLDDRGHVHVAGRCDDVVISGGENVDLREVESSMLGCVGIRQLCAVGIPDAVWGVLVGILIEEAEPGAVTAATLAAHARSRLARHKRPRRWSVVERLPLTPSGKPDRSAAASRKRPWAPLTYDADRGS